jgi:hypothetical protein
VRLPPTNFRRWDSDNGRPTNGKRNEYGPVRRTRENGRRVSRRARGVGDRWRRVVNCCVSSVFECAWVCSSRCLVKPQLGYKTARCGGELTVADRWFPSSQIHHGHTNPDGTSCRLIGKGHIDKQLVCPLTGEVVDRDRNAALNLRDWPDHASCGPVGTTAPSVPGPTEQVGTGHGADAGSSGAGGASVRPRPRGAGSGEARTQTPQGDTA